MQSPLQSGEKITPKQWKAEIQLLQAEYNNIGKEQTTTATELAYSFPKSYVSCRKPRAISTEQGEWARQIMIERNKAIGRKDYSEN